MERSVEYPRLAAFQSSEASWSIYRGFSYLHARVILELQEELRALEQELDEIDIDGDYEGESQSDNVNIRYAALIRTQATFLSRLYSDSIRYARDICCHSQKLFE